MSDIGQIIPQSASNVSPAESSRRGVERPASGQREAGGVTGRDRVELSDQALLLNRLRELPDVRQDLVDRVRASLDAGDYETPERVDGVLDALAADLDLPGEE